MNKEEKFDYFEISRYISLHGYSVSANFVIDFWRERGWKRLDGKVVKTIESAVSWANFEFLKLKFKNK